MTHSLSPPFDLVCDCMSDGLRVLCFSAACEAMWSRLAALSSPGLVMMRGKGVRQRGWPSDT